MCNACAYFFFIGKLVQDLEETYSNLTLVQDETKWQEFIYKSSTLDDPADVLDCSFVCRNVEKPNGCDLFVMEVRKQLFSVMKF